MNFQGLPAWATLCDCFGCGRNPASPAGLELKTQRGQGRRREKARLWALGSPAVDPDWLSSLRSSRELPGRGTGPLILSEEKPSPVST